MATIVGALAVELGLDTAQFEKSLKSLPGVTQTHFNSMSAEMKRTSREGAESLRLIDEALGIHISRPVARIITQEFPGLAKSLQSVLGFGVAGAVLLAGFEAVNKVIEKVSASMEHAKKAEEDYDAAQHKLQNTLADTAESFEKQNLQITEHMAKLSGDKGTELTARLQIVGLEDAEQARKLIDQLSEELLKEAKAAQEAGAWTTKFWLAVGNFVHQTFSLSSTLGIEQTNKQLEGMQHKLDAIRGPDALAQQLQLVNQFIAEANAKLLEMKANASNLGDAVKTVDIGRLVSSVASGNIVEAISALKDLRNEPKGYSDAEIAAQNSLIDGEKKIQDALQKSIDLDKRRHAQAIADAAQEDVSRGEKIIERLKSETEAQLALAAAADKTVGEQTLQQAAGEADQIISRIQEEAHGRLTKAMQEEIASVHALTAERLVAKDAVQTNQNLEKQIDAVHRQIESNQTLAASYLEGGRAIENAKIDQRLAAQIQEADKLREKYEALKKAAEDYAESTKKLGGAAGPVQGLNVSPEALAQTKTAVDAADRKVAQLRIEALSEDEAKYQVEINQTSRALADEQPLLDRLNAAYTENAQAVREAQNALALYHWEQAHPGPTVAEAQATLANPNASDQERQAAQTRINQIQQVTVQIEQQSINQQRAADAQLAARYSIARSYDDEIARLERARELMQQYGQDTLAIDAAIYEERQRSIQQWDDAAFKVGTFKDKFQATMNEVILKGEEASQRMAQAWLGAIGNVNDELAKLATGQKADFRHIVLQLAQEQTKGELEKFEGEIAGHFGLHVAIVRGIQQGAGENAKNPAGGDVIAWAHGLPIIKNFLGPSGAPGPGPQISDIASPKVASGPGQGPDGSAGKPFYVISATPIPPIEKGVAGGVATELISAAGAASSSRGAAPAGSFAPDLQLAAQLISNFGGGLASGGPVRPGTRYIVGENGPELFRSSTAGEIVPNSQLAPENAVAEAASTVPPGFYSGNQNWTFDPHAAYAQPYERYERSLHQGPGDNSLWMSLAMLGGKFLLPRFVSLFHHAPTAASTETPAGRTGMFSGFGIGAGAGDSYSPASISAGSSAPGPTGFGLGSDAPAVPPLTTVPDQQTQNYFTLALDGFRASGGSVASGATYMVGERGPEIFRPERDGEIVPNHMLHLFQNEGPRGISSPGSPMAPGPAGLLNLPSPASMLPPNFAASMGEPTLAFSHGSVKLPDISAFMADGGDVFAGRDYMVGERGRELYRIPGLSGISNDNRDLSSSRGGDTYNIHQHINENAKDLFNKTTKQLLRALGSR